MESRGVYVQVEHLTLGLAKGSGLRINNIVIIHGIILAPLCLKNNNEKLYTQYDTIMKELERMQSFFYRKTSKLNGNEKSSMSFKVLSQEPSESIKVGLNKTTRPIEDFTVKEAFVCLLHNYKGLSDSLKEISNWSYSDTGNETDNFEFGCNVLPTFIFLAVGENISNDLFEETLHGMFSSVKSVLLYPGLPLVVEATPFGNVSFINSWSRGIISKIIGSCNEGIVTDARLVCGCEGAPIYVFENATKGALIGLVIQTISWSNGEWIGFSLGLTIKSLLQSVLGIQTSKDYIPFHKLPLELHTSQVNIDRLSSSILFVRCRHKWGSGVVIDADEGLVLTCAHILDHAPESVFVVCDSGKFRASAVYIAPLSSPYDLAVLCIGRVPGLRQLPMAESAPVIGESVFAVGYPLSTESLVSINRTPTLTAGCVAKISRRGGPLQTSCCTQSGASGGALLRPPDQLLGIVVSNVRMDAITFPSFSFAISVEDIKKPISQYMKTKDPSCLSSLCNESYAAKAEWSLFDCKL